MKTLVIESEQPVARALVRVLSTPGWTVSSAADGEEGLILALRDRWDLLVIDVRLSKKSGWRVIELLRVAGVQRPILAICTDDAPEDRVRALNLGVDDCILYPCDAQELLARCRALDRRHQVDQVRSVWGDKLCPDMDRLMDRFRQQPFGGPRC